MMKTHFRRRFASFLRKTNRILFIALGLSILGVIYYLLATAGPRRMSNSIPTAERIDDPALLELSKEVDSLEKRYQQVADAGLLTDEALKTLQTAVEKQRELVRRLPLTNYAHAARLRQLEIKYDSANAQNTIGRIAQLEREGNYAAEQGDYAQALADLKEALRLQREINGTQASVQYKNYLRETSLGQTISSLEVAPINQQKEAALQTYRDALAKKRWKDALVSLTAARDFQAKINYDHPRTRYTDLQALEKLDDEIASLNATDAVIEVERLEKSAADAELVADYAKAADLYAKAASRQREINTTYPRSRFVSSPRVEEFEIRQQTALSQDTERQLSALDKIINDSLTKRHIVIAKDLLAKAIVLVEKFDTEFPRSRLQNPERKLRLSYLNVKKDHLEAIQDLVYERVAIIPGLPNLQFGSMEITQELYELVMNTNPSRTRGPTLPVESVNWNDAMEFCSRLTWILGSPVRLPAEAEYRAALKGGSGGIRAKTGDTQAAGETGSLDPNEYGVHDLLGNVAEWLPAEPEASDASHIGGSYTDELEALKASEPPKGQLTKSTRSRHIGFRIVIAAREKNS